MSERTQRDDSPVRDEVYLALKRYDFQGRQLRGVYANFALASVALRGVPERNREILAVPMNTVVEEWLGH